MLYVDSETDVAGGDAIDSAALIPSNASPPIAESMILVVAFGDCMTRTASVSQFRPEFESFLWAPIEDDKNGMLLSVLSALARLGIDPWQEAAELARLPRETAVRRRIVATPRF